MISRRGFILGSAAVALNCKANAASTVLFPIGGVRTPKQIAIAALKAADIWNDLDVLEVAELAGLVDWKGTYTPVAVNSPTFAPYLGYTGNGASSRVRTGYTPSINGVRYTLNDASMWIWNFSPTLGNAGVYDAGNSSAPFARILTLNNNSGTHFFQGGINTGTGMTIARTEPLGMFGVQRTGASITTAFQNGVAMAAPSSAASTSLPSVEQWICGANASSFSLKQIGLFAAGASLTGKEATFYSIMKAYFVAVKSIPSTMDFFGDSFTFNTAFVDEPSVNSFYPYLTNSALLTFLCRTNTTNFGVSGANSSAFAGNMLATIAAARTPIIPGIGGIYIGQNDSGAGISSAQSQANIVSGAQTLWARGYPLILIYGKHYDNLTSGADTTSVQLAANVTMRTFQQAAVTQLVGLGRNAIYVDLYAWMRQLIVNGIYIQGDALWHEGPTNTHINAIGEQIVADATVSALANAGWISRLS